MQRLIFFFFLIIGTNVYSQSDTICKGSKEDYLQCLTKAEIVWLKGLDGIVKRENKKLMIHLTSKKKIELTNIVFDSINQNWDSAVHYIFRKIDKIHQYVAIEKHSSNGSFILWINLKTGETTELNWLPVFSPDSRRIAVVSGTELYTYSSEQVEIYVIKEGKFKKEFSYKPDGALTYLGACKWIGNDHVAVKKVNYAKTNSSGKPLKSELTIGMIDNKWNILGK